MPDNSDDREARDEMLAQGEAGLFFAEALALALIDRKILDPDDVIQALDLAIDAKRTEAADGETPRLSNRAAAILAQLANSLSATRKPASRR